MDSRIKWVRPNLGAAAWKKDDRVEVKRNVPYQRPGTDEIHVISIWDKATVLWVNSMEHKVCVSYDQPTETPVGIVSPNNLRYPPSQITSTM